jgi:hypothetical protein
MKNILLFFILFCLNNNIYAQKNSNSLIIGKSIKIEKLEIAQYDFPKTMNWSDAKKACSNLGEGWRLPTMSELKFLFLYKDDYLSNMRKEYWSSSDLDYDFAVIPDFNFENDKIPKRKIAYSVRAVRLNKDFYEPIIGTTIKINNFEVAQYDLPKKLNYIDAKDGCKDLGEGWRLPTKDELNILYINKNELGNFTDNNYWSISTNNGSGAWSQNFFTSFQNLILISYSYNVRCIKEKK